MFETFYFSLPTACSSTLLHVIMFTNHLINQKMLNPVSSFVSSSFIGCWLHHVTVKTERQTTILNTFNIVCRPRWGDEYHLTANDHNDGSSLQSVKIIWCKPSFKCTQTGTVDKADEYGQWLRNHEMCHTLRTWSWWKQTDGQWKGLSPTMYILWLVMDYRKANVGEAGPPVTAPLNSYKEGTPASMASRLADD